jgi:hypothetical protein
VGHVKHNFFLLSTEGVIKEGHDAQDYTTTHTDTKYDEYFWRNSNSAFVLVEKEIYYIDHTEKNLIRYSDGKVLTSVADKWRAGESSVWSGNFSKLATDGKDLYFSLSKNVWKYDIANEKAEIIFTPELTGYNSIYGLQYKDGYLICDTNTAPPFGGGKSLAQVSLKISSEEAEENLIIKDGASLSSDGTCLFGIKCGDKISALLDAFENENVAVYDASGNELAADGNCYTGCVVKLTNGDVVTDALTVVILGDVDGNGMIDSTDYMRVKSNFVGKYSLENEFFRAADVTSDGVVDSTDYMRIKAVFIGTFTGPF